MGSYPLRSTLLLSALCLLSTTGVLAGDTFSIVAVDPATGLVGSAGASCIAGSIIISDVHPGVGAIHTQSYWNAQNQNYARSLMNQGYSPQAIIDSLVANDAAGNPTVRQYGIVDLVEGGRSAAYTGVNCMNYKNHLLAPTYAIQGNILLGQQILDGMEEEFLNTAGLFADKLMASLQGANVPGADTRCLSAGKPAISAFIRVARPGDPPGGYYLDLNVNNTATQQNPIDLLQELYDDWRATAGIPEGRIRGPRGLTLHPARPNPFNPSTTLSYELTEATDVLLTVYNTRGQEIATLVSEEQSAGPHQIQWTAGDRLPSGIYLYRLKAGAFSQTRRLVLLK
jgi:uncharacterized Ntn-hydrolase superfamily protein